MTINDHQLQPKDNQMALLKNGQTEIYYETHGNGEPLLLIAGLASDSQSWATVLPDLSKEFKIIVFDNRGVGRTKCPVNQITIEGMADDAVALLDHLKIDIAHIVGHSMGGFVAQHICINHPQRVDKLVLAATSAVTSERDKSLLIDMVKYWENGMDRELWFRNLFYWIFSPRFFQSADYVAEIVNMAIQYPWPQNLDQFSKQVEAINMFNCSADISKIKNKTLVISGEEDVLFPTAEMFKGLSAINGAGFVTVQNAAHAIFIENPEGFVNSIINFLKN